jgi:hypothetical protein
MDPERKGVMTAGIKSPAPRGQESEGLSAATACQAVPEAQGESPGGGGGRPGGASVPGRDEDGEGRSAKTPCASRPTSQTLCLYLSQALSVDDVTKLGLRHLGLDHTGSEHLEFAALGESGPVKAVMAHQRMKTVLEAFDQR